MQKYIYIILLIITTYGCCNRIQKIIENKDKLLSICKNKELWRRGNGIYLLTYQDGLENTYILHINDSVNPQQIVFDTCFIEFSPDSVIEILCDSTCQCQEQLCNYIANLKTELDLLYIREFGKIGTKNPMDFGSSFRLENGDILEYRPRRTGEIENYKKVSEGWYLYDE
jgi:hypothetical protein